MRTWNLVVKMGTSSRTQVTKLGQPYVKIKSYTILYTCPVACCLILARAVLLQYMSCRCFVSVAHDINAASELNPCVVVDQLRRV